MRDRDHGPRGTRRPAPRAGPGDRRPGASRARRAGAGPAAWIRQAASATSLRWPPDSWRRRQREVVPRGCRARAAGSGPARPVPVRRPPPTGRAAPAAGRARVPSSRGRRSRRAGPAPAPPRGARASSAATSGRAARTVASAVRSSPSGFCSRYAVTRPLRRTTSPAVGCSRSARIRSSVDFPAPFGPTMPIRAPSHDLEVEVLEDRPRAERLLDTDEGGERGHGRSAAFSSRSDGRRVLGQPPLEVRADRRPLVVEHRVPRRVAVPSLDDHVLAEDALEREPEPFGRGARPGVQRVALPLHAPVPQLVERLPQHAGTRTRCSPGCVAHAARTRCCRAPDAASPDRRSSG